MMLDKNVPANLASNFLRLARDVEARQPSMDHLQACRDGDVNT